MAKRWLGRIVAALLLLSIPAAAWWRAPEAPPFTLEAAPAVQAEAGAGCGRLAELEPVELVVRLPDGTVGLAGTGYRDPEDELVMAPVRRLITPLAPGPWGLFWDRPSRTASMLREGQVLSIHLPEGREMSAVAVLNGEPVGAAALLCQDRLYASLRLLADGLGLRYRWRDARSILVEAR